ncbi:MAG: AEC family transporter [Rhizobacter sp.]|nr:AEC family transporter [Rhizobacter sp.]
MLDVLAITGPIYLAIALGFATTRWGLFSKADMQVFGKFVINLALPALLFRALSTRPIGEIFNLTFLLAYAIGSLGLLALSLFWARRLRGMGHAASTFHAMGMTCSNSGFVGYPILLLTFAPVAGVALALCMVVENLLVIPLLLTLAERGRGDPGPWHRVGGQMLLRLTRNPLVIAITAGLAVSLLGWRMPVVVAKTVDLFAMASGGASLFAIGGTLVGLAFKGLGQRVAPIVVGKLLLHPLAVAAALLLLAAVGLPELDAPLRTAAVLMAAMPMMGIYPILAQAYGQEDFAAPAMLVATVASFFTLSGLLWALQRFAA